MTTVPVAVASGCPWPVDAACFEDSWEGLDDDVKERSVAMASATLHRLTGYRVGGCPVKVRPCRRSCWEVGFPSYYDMLSYGSGVSFWPHIDQHGMWVNSCGCGPRDCSCDVNGCRVTLPSPVGSVTEVKVDGDVMSPSAYTLSGSDLLWAGTGDCPWPTCQNLALPDTADGTFSVTYLNSHPVDTLGAYAAGVMAMEFAKACTGGKCRLPSSVTAVVRQGVSFEIMSGAFPDGLTGIREVDTYLAMWNPGRLRQQTAVWSPDIRR